MEAEEKKEEGFFSALFKEPNAENIFILAEKLGKKVAIFEEVNVATTAVALLLGHSLSAVYREFKSSQTAVVSNLTKQLLSHALSLLSGCGPHYLPALRQIQCLCTGESELSDEDITVLKQIVTNEQSTLDELLKEKDVTSTDVDSSTIEGSEDIGRRDSKTDGRVEMQKLFSHMKTGRKKAGSLPAVHFERPHLIESSTEEFLVETVRQFKQLGGGQRLLEFCQRIPVLVELSEKKKDILTAGSKSEQQERVFQLKSAVDAILIVSTLSSSCFLPLTSHLLTDITHLVQQCILISTTILSCFNNTLTASTKQKVVMELGDSESSDAVSPASVVELFGRLSCCHINSSLKSLICDVIVGTVKVVKKIESLIKESPRAKSLDVFNTLIAYDLFCGLKPLLLPSLKNTELKIAMGQTKFTVPLGQLTLLGVQLTNDLLSLLSEDPEQESSLSRIQATDIDINGSYSRWQLVQLLMESVSLFSILLSVSHSSFKKALLLIESPSQDGSQSELGGNESFNAIKPERSEKQEQLFRRLQDSLSSKISETMAAKEETEKGEEREGEGEEERSRSVSPSSTVSSSGVVQGEYIVNADQEEQQEDEQDDDLESLDYEDVEAVMGALLLPSFSATPTNVPPPPPPLPPKRSKMAKPETLTPLGPPLPPRGMKYFQLKGEGMDVKRKPLFYQSLALISLKTLLQGIVQNPCRNLQSFLVHSIGVEHVASLTWLFLNVQNLALESEKPAQLVSFNEFSSVVPELIHDLIVGGALSSEHHGPLLRDLGLHPGCWPLSIVPSTLSLLARVLIIRSEKEDDPLSLNIWKGFLSTLEENAANENENEEDLPVTHLQLLLLVWHSFSESIRKSLLLQCVTAVNRVAEEKESGSLVPPLACCRLLLVLHYMLFQFNEPVSELAQQVENNLLSGIVQFSPVSLEGVSSFPCDQELQYQRVLSKPGVATESKKKKLDIVQPLFYNIIPPELSDSKEEKGIDPDACKILLNCSSSKEKEKSGYNQFHQSLINLMSCGTDYRLHSESVYGRVIAACAGHQCMDLSLHMLICLPPSHSVLTAIVDGTGLSCEKTNGSSLLILVLLFSVKLRIDMRLQKVDTDDIIDTLTEAGYATEVAEELTGRVMSVVESTEHFFSLAISVLNKLCGSEDGDNLPLVSITATNLLICLLQRSLQEYITLPEPEEDEEDEDEEEETERENDDESKEEGEETEEKSSKTDEEEKLKLTFYESHSQTLIPVLLKVTRKIITCSHRYICRDLFNPDQNLAEDMIEVINRILGFSSTKLITGKNQGKSLFVSHIPVPMTERLKKWNSTPVLDKTQTHTICFNHLDKINIMDEVFSYLHCSFKSFCGTFTFSPNNLLKTTLFTSTSLLLSLFNLSPSKSREEFADSVVPMATDLVTEFLSESGSGESDVPPLREIAKLFDAKGFSLKCVRHKVIECFKLVQCPQLNCHTFQGAVLEDCFVLLSNILDSSADWPILVDFDNNSPPTNIIDLVLMCSVSSLATSSLTEALRLLVKILELNDKATHDHLTILCGQITTLALVPPDKLEVWLRRIVLGCVNDSTSDAVLHTNLLFQFVNLLAKDDCPLPSHICHVLLSSLLSIGSDLVKELAHIEVKHLSIFKDFFQSCIMLAGKQSDQGHYNLVTASSQWLPVCAKLMESYNGKQNNEVLIPVSTILTYISNLSSAVQLLTNKSVTTERRGIAAEDDYSVLIEEDEDESLTADNDEENQDSEEEGLNEKLCTFTETKRDFRNQHWYHCHTCKLTDGTGCCNICVKVCHKGHDVTYSKLGSFFCDCGAKEDGSCKALVKRKPKSHEDRTGSPSLGDVPLVTEGRQRRKRKRKTKSKKAGTDKVSVETKKSSDNSNRNSSYFPTSFMMKLAREIEPYKEAVQKHFLTSSAPQCCLELLQVSLPQVISRYNRKAMGSYSEVEASLNELHTCDKKIEHVDNILSSAVACQENAVDNIKLTVSGERGQLVKQLLNSGGIRVIRRCATAALTSSRYQHLVISQDKGKLTLLQLASLLKQADSSRRKLNISRLSTVMVPFSVMSLCANPCNGEVLAVCGVKDCQVITINSSGHVNERINLHPSVDSATGYIVKCMWLPGSQTELAIVTDSFVKIYDLAVDPMSPVYYFITCSEKIRDACFVITEETKSVLVIMSNGQIFCQPVIPECNASEGPVYFTVDFIVKHSSIQESEGQVCEGGASVYYSQALQMLFISYKNGKTFMATLDGTLSKTEMVVEIPLKSNTITSNGKSTTPALLDWQEVPQHPGLISAVTGGTSNLVMLLVKPDSVLIHEAKPLSAKSRIQGTVVVKPHAPPDTSSRTAVLMISEDGSLRAQYCNNSDAVLHWLQKQYQPATPLAYLTQSSKKLVKIKKRTTPPKIPVDFFENCTRMQNNELEFGGSDILHVYNKEQVRNRFNVGGLYIANTKPGGFTIDVTNLQPDTNVMVGARILLGCRSLERTPSYIELFGRKQEVTFPGGIARWFDVPMTREESLQSDKMFQLTFGPSMDASGVNIVDCVRIYMKTKEDFGWPERPLTPGIALTRGGLGEEGEGDREIVQLAETQRLAPVDRLVCNAFSVIANHCLSSSLLTGTSEVIGQITPLLNLSTHSSLQYHTCFLISCVAKATATYRLCKDYLQLSHVKDNLFNESSLFQPELYQHLLLILLAISRSRPDSLVLVSAPFAETLKCCLSEGEESQEIKSSESEASSLWSELINKLNAIFWILYKKKPANINTAPVCNTGLVAIELTVNVLVEIMYTVSLQFPNLLNICIPHWIKLLTTSDSQVSSACVKSLTKLLKPCPLKPSQEPEEEKPIEESEEVDEAKEPSTTEQEPAPAAAADAEPQPPPAPPQEEGNVISPPNLQALLANPQAAMEHLMAEPGMFGMMPDEEAMMNLAIAMSLNSQENQEEAAQAMQNVLQGLNVPERSMSPILRTSDNQPAPSDRVHVVALVDNDEDTEEDVHVNDVVLNAGMMIDSLNSSYEDLVGDNPPMQQLPVLNVPPVLAAAATDEGSSKSKTEERASQDVSSELDNPNDSSGEEDAEEDSSFLDVYEQFDKVASETSVADDREEEGGVTGEGETAKATQSQKEAMSREHRLRLNLLVALSEHLPEIKTVGGARAIPYMQVVLFLCGCLESGHRDGETYKKLLLALLKQLDMSSHDVSDMMTRSKISEVLLLFLRFLNIIMSRKRIKTGKLEGNSASRLWYHTADTLLSWNCMSYCLNILKGLLKDKSNFQVEESSTSNVELLKTHSHVNLTDMSPFFQQQYVKYHAADIFETYSVLLADIVLALPCQLKKFCDKTSSGLLPVEFDTEWMETLCEYFMATSNSSGSNKKQIRKVLIYVCGSKETYRLVRDKYALRNYMNKISEICSTARFDASDPSSTLIHLSYETLLKMIEQLRLCDEVARTRTDNWQAFCQEKKDTIPTLFTISLTLDEGLSMTLLQLIYSALSGIHPTVEKEEARPSSLKERIRRQEEKEKQQQQKPTPPRAPINPELNQMLCLLLLETVNDNSFEKFVNRYLLQSNQSSIRWQTHSLIHTLYKHCPPTQQVHIVQLLWKLWPDIPKHGHKASQFIDLLGYCSISTPQVLEKENMCHHLVRQAIELLRQQNVLVTAHPNCHVYSQLVSLVDFDGHYLESEPCLVCNDPEVALTTMKLFSIKSDVRYSANTIFVKLNGSHMFTQLLMRVSEIRRSKMMRTINLYYSNRTIQNVIELKNNRSLWLKACSCTLQPSQTDLKFEFPLPIVARNVILEFSDFYESTQVDTLVLQCPRCNASVPAHPGVCAACGENAHQCQKCRTINYDERDPFLCISCGFSKYARFEILVEGRACSAVDPIENEDDRQKTLLSINQLLEKADTVYKQLVQHRNQLDQLLVELASGPMVASSFGSSESGVNRAIQAAAHLYCSSCKNSYHDLSKIIQSVLASRRELVAYDVKKLKSGKVSPPIEPVTPLTPMSEEGHTFSLSLPLSAAPLSEGNCFGCASATLEHCITVLKALAFKPETRKLMKKDLIEELMEFNLRAGSVSLQKDVQGLLCQLTRDDLAATCNLNDFIMQRVLQCIKPQRVSPNLASAIQAEMMLLTASVAMEDSCWEERLRTVMRLFKKSRSHTSPVVMAAVTLPCLKILHSIVNANVPVTTKDNQNIQAGRIHTNVNSWLKGEPNVSFEKWKEASLVECSKETQLARKYSQIWLNKTLRAKANVPLNDNILKQTTWLRNMLFNRSSSTARKMAFNILYSLCNSNERRRQTLDLLSSFLDEVGSAGEASQEFLSLFSKLMTDDDGKWKLYLSRRGILLQIGALIGKEINYLRQLEESTLSSDLSQGYALEMLTTLLKSFLEVESIKQQYKGQLVGLVLNGYLSLKRLVIQRTKRVDESQKILLQLLEALTSGTEEERQELMAICIDILSHYPMTDLVTPIFVFEQLCNIIHPEEEDVGEFYLQLDKDPQQEEFLQGRMQGNPYSSKDPGLGPLMRDVKNKICTDCELVALLEDDTGMELLVCNKIISLDLPVKEVYKKIWCAQPNRGDRMKIVYRMRGLLGDATEDMVETLDNDKGEDVDEEEIYKMANVLGKANRLDAILIRLSQAKHFLRSHGLIHAGLKLLSYCVKVKSNRQYLIQSHLNTLKILLGILNMALQHEQLESSGLGATVAQQVLSVTEPILQEASSQQRVIVRSISDELIVTDTDEDDSTLQTLLRHVESPFVQSNLGVREGLMHIIPFLTFGDPRNMKILLEHFAPYLDFERFDQEDTPEHRLYLDCFCVVATGIGTDASGQKLKDLLIEMKITPSVVEYIMNKTPPKGSGRFDSPEWVGYLTHPSLPYVLKILAGLSQHHTRTQLMCSDVIPQVHLLEQVASTVHHIGTLAEKLLEVLRQNPDCDNKIQEVRKTTRSEKKKRAMEMRAKELGALGFQVNEKGQVVAETPTAFKEMESEVMEETGLRCCICLEGYRNQPQKILGVYTYTRKVTLDEFENKPRKTVGYATVSHFNVVHYECHSAAIKLARSRDEWESATLQNANTRCNGLLPIWGPKVSDSAFANGLASHNSYLQACTGLYDPSFRSYSHDLRLLLLRFAHETSFSAESGGGGPESNLHLIPYFIHVALYVLDTTRVYQREEKNLNGSLTAPCDKWVSMAYEVEGPLHSAVLTLFLFSLSQWEENRLVILRQLLVLAHARKASSSPIKNLPTGEVISYSGYKPVLVFFGLIDAIHRLLKKNITVSGTELPQAVLEYIRNNDKVISDDCDKVLSKYQDELLPAESFEEFCDIMGLLTLIENPGVFLKELIASVTNTSV